MSRVPYSDDTHHECVDGAIVEDINVPTETNEYDERRCARCGERILVKPLFEFVGGRWPEGQQKIGGS